MVSSIINASPTVVDLGRDDKSTRVVPVEPIPRPTHLPKFWLFTEKGPLGPQLVSSAAAKQMYGSASFDPLKPYYNHASLFATSIMAEGNICMLERVVPADAVVGSLILWCEVADETLTVYQRDPATGKYILDSNGDPQADTGAPATTLNGKVLRWRLEAHTATNIDNDFGNLSSQSGSVLTNSTEYPILELKAKGPGAFANLAGIRIYPAKEEELPSGFITKSGVFPYWIEVIRKPDAASSAKTLANNFGEGRTLFSFEPNSINGVTTAELDIEKKFLSWYENSEDPRYPLTYSDFGEINVYHTNISTIQALIHQEMQDAKAALSPGGTNYWNDAWFDYDAASTSTDVDPLNNILTLTSTKGAPYSGAELATGANAGIYFSKTTDNLMANGVDGTMDNSTFDSLVSAKALEYLDPNSRVQDNAINVESIFYDSGFGMQTKKDLMNVLAIRKDTFLALTTYIDGNPAPSISDDMATATSLATSLAGFPDSEFFGTKVFRAMIVAQTGFVRNHTYTKRTPLLLEMAIKAARYMGAANSKWKNGAGFDYAPGNIIDHIYKIEADFIPANTKYLMWDKQLVWAQPFDRKRYFFPAGQTAYDNDTSVLNNFITAMAAVELDKIGWDAWRNFTGVSSLTDAQLSQRVIEYVNDRVRDKFDDRFVVIPEAFMTEADALRGYSWTLVIKLYAPNMKTVETLKIETYRIGDLGA